MSNITKTNVRRLFAKFCKINGIPTSATYLKNKRRWSKKWLKLDYHAGYGGFRMDWVFKDTSTDFFSGEYRRNTKEMYHYLLGLIEGKQRRK